MPSPRILAFAQLIRLPNVFTAFADIALGVTVALSLRSDFPGYDFWLHALLLALASGSLYLAGMVWNDLFDRAEDATTRAFRPLPSGRVSLRAAIVLGIALSVAGLVFAGLAGLQSSGTWNSGSLGLAIAILVAVFLYDGWLKRTPAGPVAMALCRFLNVLLGLSIIGDELLQIGPRLHLAGVVGLYIVGVTWFARTEEGPSRPAHLKGAASVIGLSLVGAFLVRLWPGETAGTLLFPYLLVLFGFTIGVPITRAISRPGPREVQTAVKRSVLGLIALDAVLGSAFLGVPALLLLLLLLPAVLLGKWVYST